MKNIALLAGRPLLLHTLDCIREAGLLARCVVSTEDTPIAQLAGKEGARVMARPAELASDAASTESVLLHVLGEIEKEGWLPPWVMTLPPTAPLRKPETVRQFADRAAAPDSSADCFMSVTENRGDFWLYGKEGEFRRLFPDAPRRQQDRAPLYEENSAIYLTRASALKETGSILGRSVSGIVISSSEGFDINTPEDLLLAEALIHRSLRN